MDQNDLRYTLIEDHLTETVLGLSPTAGSAPEDWGNSVVGYSRNETFFGLIRSLTIPLIFVKQAAAILRHAFYTKGIKADVRLRLETLQADWSYKTVYENALDFSNITDGFKTFTINALNSGLEAAIKAYTNAQYEIPVNVPEAVTISIPGLRLIESARLIFTPQGTKTVDFFPGLQIEVNEVKATRASVQNVDLIQKTNPSWSASGKNFYTANSSGDLKISGYIDITTVNDNFYFVGAIGQPPSKIQRVNTLDISVYNQSGVKLKTFFSSTETSRSYHVDLTASISVNIGDKLYFYFDSNHDGVPTSLFGDGFFEINAGELDLSYYTKSDPTDCKCLPAKYVFDQLMQNINGGLKVPTKSYLLGTKWQQLLITSGDAIRRLNTKQVTNPDDTISVIAASPSVKTNLNDFFQSTNAVTNCGLGVENGTAVLEGKDYFFQRTIKSASFGKANWTTGLTVNANYLYNTIKGGYPNQTYDEVNGRDEFNSETNYSTPVSAVAGATKELNLQSVYRADMYGIEYTRINLSGKTSVDSGSDNDTFFIYANPGLTAPEGAEALGYYSGVTAGNTLYNWRISPKRNLLRHGSFLRSCFFRLENYRIKFGSALKNKDLVTTDLQNLSVKESADILIGSLDPPLFIPYNIGINTQMSRDFLTFVDSNPRSYVDFEFEGNIYKAFLTDFKFNIAKDSSQDFTGLFTPDNDLTKLIR